MVRQVMDDGYQRSSEYSNLRIVDGQLVHTSGKTVASSRSGEWVVPVSQVRVVAEDTRGDQPILDYLFVIVFGSPPQGMWVAMEALSEGGTARFLEELGALLGRSLETRLMGELGTASNVIWPPAISGEEFWVHVSEPRRGILGRIADWVAPRVSVQISPAVMAYLGEGVLWME
jgi:hypothetical protein